MLPKCGIKTTSPSALSALSQRGISHISKKSTLVGFSVRWELENKEVRKVQCEDIEWQMKCVLARCSNMNLQKSFRAVCHRFSTGGMKIILPKDISSFAVRWWWECCPTLHRNLPTGVQLSWEMVTEGHSTLHITSLHTSQSGQRASERCMYLRSFSTHSGFSFHLSSQADQHVSPDGWRVNWVRWLFPLLSDHPEKISWLAVMMLYTRCCSLVSGILR